MCHDMLNEGGRSLSLMDVQTAVKTAVYPRL